MSEALQDALQPVLARWTMGGMAAQLAPDGLRGKLGDDPDEAELRLLVIAGQALGTLVVPEPAGELEGLADLPALSLPTMPDHLRPLAARALSRNEDWLRMGVLRLIEARGYVVHPSDWMPSRTGEVPSIYAPWQDWLAGLSGDTPTRAADLSARWDHLGPAGRRMLLTALRADDPQAALDVVAQRASGQPAEQRLWMVQTLSKGLTERDRAFLEGLSTDRAPTVRNAANRLLKRLGGGATVPAGDDEAARDIVDFLKVETHGLLKRQRVIVAVPIRNHPQSVRRSGAMAALDVATLASLLGVAATDLPAMMQWGQDVQLDREMVALILGTGAEDVVNAFEEAVAGGAPIGLDAVADGLERLDGATVATMARRTLTQTRSLPSVVHMLPTPGIIDDPRTSPAWRDLLLDLHRDDGAQAGMGRDEMPAMGILATSRAAAEIIERLGALGVPTADPRLDVLRINAAL
jgi:hypothetical protein